MEKMVIIIIFKRKNGTIDRISKTQLNLINFSPTKKVHSENLNEVMESNYQWRQYIWKRQSTQRPWEKIGKCQHSQNIYNITCSSDKPYKIYDV